MSEQVRKVYLRFGRIPKGGFSRVDGCLRTEAGCSAYEGFEYRDGRVLIDLNLPGGFRSGLARRCLARGRRLYVIAGEHTGTGSDGEPLLSCAEYVREVAPDELAGLLPERDYLRQAAEHWRRKRLGEDPGSAAFVHLCPPDELPPRTHREATGKGFWELVDERVEEGTRELAYKWGLGEFYEEERRQRSEPPEERAVSEPLAPGVIEERLVIGDPLGLHCRPLGLICSRLSKEGIEATVDAGCGGKRVRLWNGASARQQPPWSSALKLKARRGDEILVRCDGPGGARALEIARELVETSAPSHGSMYREVVGRSWAEDVEEAKNYLENMKRETLKRWGLLETYDWYLKERSRS